MSYRATCSGLVSRLRDLIGDPAVPTGGEKPVWTNDQLQSALDRRRQVVRYLSLRPERTRLPGGSVVYLDYYAECGDWEADAKLYDAASNELTPETKDLETGHWTFAADTLRPVYLVGKTYDLYAAAADVLEKWAAKVKLDFTFSPGAGGGQFAEAQKHQMILATAAGYRAQQRIEVASLTRSDVNAY